MTSEYKHFQRVNGVGVKVESNTLSILENLRSFSSFAIAIFKH